MPFVLNFVWTFYVKTDTTHKSRCIIYQRRVSHHMEFLPALSGNTPTLHSIRTYSWFFPSVRLEIEFFIILSISFWTYVFWIYNFSMKICKKWIENKVTEMELTCKLHVYIEYHHLETMHILKKKEKTPKNWYLKVVGLTMIFKGAKLKQK